MLAYLARYTHRVAIANSRLIAADDDGVTFTWKDYRFEGRDRYKTMTLAPDEFIRRFLLHVLPKGFHRIRHYGLLASAARKANIARARELLAAPEPETVRDETTSAAAAPIDHRPPCPCCGGRMIIVETFERGGGPRDPPRPNPGSGPRRHDPQQRLITAQARRRPSPPATARRHPRPIDPTPRTANRTDIDRPGRA